MALTVKFYAKLHQQPNQNHGVHAFNNSAQSVARIEVKNLDTKPDDTIRFDKGILEVANVDDVTIGRFTFEPEPFLSIGY